MFAPSVEIAAALASTMAQRSLKVVTAVSPSLAFASLASKTAPRAKAGCEAQARATAPVSRSEALGSSQCSRNFHAANASATQLAPAAALDQRWRLNRCSLHLNYPPPLARGEVVAASRRLLTGLRKPEAAASQAPASPYEAARIGQATWPALRLFALKPSQNKGANFKRLHCGLVVYERSSASLITRPAGVQIKTLNPKRFVSGWYWGGLKQPPRRAAPRPSGSRRAASEGKP